MVNTTGGDGILQCSGYVLLTHNVGKGEWAPFSSGNDETLLVGHDLYTYLPWVKCENCEML